MNLRYTLTRDMLIQLTEFLLMRGTGFAEAQWAARKRSGLWMAFWLLNLFIYAVSGLISDDNWLRFWIMPSIFFLGLHLYHILFDTSRAMKLVHERAVREVDRRPADERTEEVDFQATADYFLVSTPRAQLALRPDQIKQIYYDDQLLYLFYQSDRALLLPQAAFAGEEARNALFNHLYRLNPPLYQATRRLTIKDLIPKEGFFDSPVKIVATSLGVIGLGAVLLLMAGPLIFQKMYMTEADGDHEPRQTYDATNFLTQVDDAQTLLQFVGEKRTPIFWTPIVDGDPKKPTRCIVNLILPYGEGKAMEPTAKQLAAFTAVKTDYPSLKARLLPAMLAAYHHYRDELASYGTDGETDPAKLPDLKSPEELAARLSLSNWTIHRSSRGGLAFSSLRFKPDWDKDDSYGMIGALFLGDQVIYAGRQPEAYMNMDLSKEPRADQAPEFIPDPMAAPVAQPAPAAEAAPEAKALEP